MKSIKELRDMSFAELRDELRKTLGEQFRLRIAKATQQLKSTHQVAELRKHVARIKTLLAEKLLSTKNSKES